jgi:uncharacterized membrane protein YbhN (UPF0104 family)
VHTNWEPKAGAAGPGLKQALTGPVDYGALGIAGVLIATAVAITFVRWYILVRALDLPVSPQRVTRLCLVGYFWNTLLPGAIGGDIVKAASLVRSEDRRTAAVSSIIFDRAIGLGGLILVVVLVGGFFYLRGDEEFTQQTLMYVLKASTIATAVSLLGWVGLYFLPEWNVNRFAQRLEKLPGVGQAAAEAWRSLCLYCKRPRAVAVALGMTVIVHICNVFAFDQCARVFAPDHSQLPSLQEHMVLVPVGIAIKALFPAPGGVGGAEFSFGKMYELINHAAALGVLASLAFLLSTWVLAAISFVAAQFIPADQPEAGEANVSTK